MDVFKVFTVQEVTDGFLRFLILSQSSFGVKCSTQQRQDGMESSTFSCRALLLCSNFECNAGKAFQSYEFGEN